MVCKEEGGTGVASDGSRRRLGAVTPGETLGTLYNSHVGTNKTKQYTKGNRGAHWHTATVRDRDVGQLPAAALKIKP